MLLVFFLLSFEKRGKSCNVKERRDIYSIDINLEGNRVEEKQKKTKKEKEVSFERGESQEKKKDFFFR